ncbi:hypothetical protein PF008_g3334 [Phytophthora fragariae]|uniref:Myb/SANT-like DNA-binding domain-containing protein n=1 Tax=Phytophthora fragariae TaxID=53985 RepID=A0A6G0SER3_9STRA|nr:hypothetical protein PF008_g3334 [Phytophthora fragariae]
MYSAASPPLATNALLASIALLDESTASLHQTQSGAGELMSGSGLAVTAARQSAPTEASLAGTGQDGTAKSTASWNDEDVEELFRLRYKVLDGRFKNTKDTKRIKFAWSVLASTLSVNQSKVFTDQQCQSKMKNVKQKWASTRAAVGRTGNDGPIRRPNHYSTIKNYWGEATGMKNRPHLSTEDSDTIAAAGDSASISAASLPSTPAATGTTSRRTISATSGEPSTKRVKRTQGECVEAGLSAVAKGFCEGLEALGKGLAVAQSDGGDGPAAAVPQQTEIFRQQSEVANDQNTQFLLQIQAQSERLKLQNDNIRELLDLIRRDGASN